MRAAVYTAIAGSYDDLKPHPDILGVDFIAFASEPADGWEVRPLSGHGLGDAHPRDIAKFYKLMPHRVLPDHDFTVWIDGSHEILSETFVMDCIAATMTAGMALYQHPWRNCIYDEAEASIVLPKYQGLPITEQVAAYRAEGHPENWGLYATGTIARVSDVVEPLMNEWADEILHWTYQDQLSLPVVCQRSGFRPDTFPCHQVHSNSWTRIHPHHRED